MAARKTARQKLEAEHPSHGRAFAIPPAMRRSLGRGTMIVPRPLDVDAAMRAVRKGSLITPSRIRARLAAAAGADHTCPLTTGIFIRLAAEASEEDAASGRRRVTPWWRTVGDDGRLNPKLPGGGRLQAARLRSEGISVRAGQRGRFVVKLRRPRVRPSSA